MFALLPSGVSGAAKAGHLMSIDVCCVPIGPCRSLVVVLTASLTFVASSPSQAGTSFGVYDARTLAMGSVAVASANNDNAQFYNSALLAFNDQFEEKTRDARFLFPIIVPQLAESTISIGRLAFDDPAESISLAVDNFNAMPDTQSAQRVINVTSQLDAALADIDDEDVFADIYVGLAVSEPGKFQGAGFFLGRRVIAAGRPSETATDRALLAAYREGLDFIASGGSRGAEHPELFDANGALIDPGANLDSTVAAVGVEMTEVGIAMSKQMRLFGFAVAGGISIKVLDIATFEDVERIVDDRPRSDQKTVSDVGINLDVGLAKDFGEYWRVGLAVKDIIPHSHETAFGTDIRFQPRPRAGLAFRTSGLQIAADIDLIPNETLGDESATQDAAVGAEWMPGSLLRFRAGYRHDLQGNRSGAMSVGFGTVWKRLAVDLAYSDGSDSRAAALQFGIVF